jgi:hypothetical protein
MLSGPLSKDSIVIKEENGKFVLNIKNIRFGTFHLKENAEKFGKFLKKNIQYIVIDPQERGSCVRVRIRIFGFQSNFGCFKEAHIDSVKTFLSENIIPSEKVAAIQKSTGGGCGGSAPARTSSGDGGGGPKRRSNGSGDGGGATVRTSSGGSGNGGPKRRSGGGGGATARTSSGGGGGGGGPKRRSSGDSGGGDASKRRSSDSGGSSGSGGVGEQIFNMRVSQDQKPQQGLLPQYFRGFLDPSEKFQEQKAYKQGGEDRYFS